MRNLSRLCHKIRKARDQLERKVVNGIEPEIFKCLERRGLTRTGETGKNHQLARFAIVRLPSLFRRAVRGFAVGFFALAETFALAEHMEKS